MRKIVINKHGERKVRLIPTDFTLVTNRNWKKKFGQAYSHTRKTRKDAGQKRAASKLKEGTKVAVKRLQFKAVRELLRHRRLSATCLGGDVELKGFKAQLDKRLQSLNAKQKEYLGTVQNQHNLTKKVEDRRAKGRSVNPFKRTLAEALKK